MVNKDDNGLFLLLEEVKGKYPFKIVHSKDCDNLADDVFKVTGERISGSTIKRLLGFMKTASNPNKFTLNVLARYFGHDNYLEFLTSCQLSEKKSEKDEKADFIAYVKSSSLTQPEKWIDHSKGKQFISDFLKSDKIATAIISEGGTGKTTLIAQFLESFESRCCVLWGAVLRRKDLSLCDYLQTIKDQFDIVIIDEIEETAYNFSEIRTIFFELEKFLSLHNDIELIVAVRSYTWMRITDVFSEASKNKWFGVNFNVSTIDQCRTLEPLQLEGINVDNELFINTPFLSPFYLKLKERNENPSFTNDWETLNQFFAEKVFNTAYAYEKKLFFDTILEQTDYGLNGSRVSRDNMQSLITKYKKAYVDLVSYNILKEEKELNKYGVFRSFYRFGYAAFFEFTILSYLLDKHEGFNSHLLEEINSNYHDERKLNLLKLAVSFALSQYEKNVPLILDLELIEFERQALMIHIGYQIRLGKRLQDEIFPQFIKSKNGRKYFIERWIDEEHLNGFYGEGLKQYLTIISNPQDIIFANALLYYNAFLRNDEIECKKRAEIIKDTKSMDIHPFVLGRKCMTLMLEEYRKDKKLSEVLKSEIEHFLNKGLNESDKDLPVHFAGFEHNILHAEFLSGHYHFTKRILKKLSNMSQKLLHPKDADAVLLKIFDAAYNNKPLEEMNLDSIHPWYRYTVKNYISRISS